MPKNFRQLVETQRFLLRNLIRLDQSLHADLDQFPSRILIENHHKFPYERNYIINWTAKINFNDYEWQTLGYKQKQLIVQDLRCRDLLLVHYFLYLTVESISKTYSKRLPTISHSISTFFNCRSFYDYNFLHFCCCFWSSNANIYKSFWLIECNNSGIIKLSITFFK